MCGLPWSQLFRQEGHAKAWPSGILSFGTSSSGLVFKTFDLLVMTKVFMSFLIMEFMSMTVDPTLKVSFFVMSYNVPFAAIDWSANPTVTDSLWSPLAYLYCTICPIPQTTTFKAVLYGALDWPPLSKISIKITKLKKKMIYCNYSNGNINTEIKKIIFTLNMKFVVMK